MMPTIISIGERLRGKIAAAVEANQSIEIKDLAIRFIVFFTLNSSKRKRFSRLIEINLLSDSR